MDGCGVHVEPPVGRAAPPRRTPARDAVRRGARTSGRGEWTLCRVVKSGVRRNKTKRRIERRQTPGRRSASEQARRSPYPTYQDEMRICSPWQRERRGERGNESTAPATAARPSPQAPQDRRTSGAHTWRRTWRRNADGGAGGKLRRRAQTRRPGGEESRGVERSRDRPRSPEIAPRSARDRPRSVDLVVAPSAAPHLLLVRRRLRSAACVFVCVCVCLGGGLGWWDGGGGGVGGSYRRPLGSLVHISLLPPAATSPFPLLCIPSPLPLACIPPLARLHGDLGGGRRRRPCRRVEHAARRYLQVEIVSRRLHLARARRPALRAGGAAAAGFGFRGGRGEGQES